MRRSRRRRRADRALLVGLATLTLIAAACTAGTPPSGTPPSSAPGGSTGSVAAPRVIDTSTRGSLPVTLAADAEPTRCDPVAPRLCLLPFPNDYFTVADSSTATGRRVAFAAESMPANKDGVRVDPTDWNRADGFSPGSPIMTSLGAVDLAASGAAPVTDIAASARPDSPTVVIDTATGERVPHWVELSQGDVGSNPDERQASRMLVIHPARNLLEGHRHVVALRSFVASTPEPGRPVAPSDAFRALRDRLDSGVAAIEQRRGHMEEVFADLGDAGVGRDDLQLAWDFTVASGRSLAGRVLAARDDMLATLADRAPAFTVASVEEDVDERIARRVTGTFQVPSYLTGDGSAGTRYELGADGLPRRNGEITMPFRCIVPRAAVDPAATAPARASLYGHGLLGSENEVSAGNVRSMAQEHDIVFCATRWIGLSTEDIVNAASILTDFSRFPTLADRSQQGMLGFVALGRLMTRPGGLAEHPAFQVAGRPVYDTAHLFYDGNSQGGVMGGALVAVSPDLPRAVLGVPGMNYSLLLPRSKDFEQFDVLFRGSYPDALERTLLLGIVQMLWDRAETNGYAQHLSRDPYPGTPAHAVLLHVAYGDFQVAPVSAENEARTIGARIHQPAVAAGRSPDVTPYWGLEPVPTGPDRVDGSVIVIWDSGTPTPPTEPVVPTAGRDPHEDPRNSAAARQQKSDWLRPDGTFVDVCDARACTAEPAR